MLPLEGLTVVAVEQAVAAPFCSSRLADAGAIPSIGTHSVDAALKASLSFDISELA
jgi:hypothetical protein